MVFAMWEGEWDVHWLDEVDSTNTYVLHRAHQGAEQGFVVVADHQTAGRGRLGRRWESPPGANLLASILLRPDCGPDDVHLCTAAVALAGADACRAVAGVEAMLKWPNDLYVGDAKLAGVLADADFAGERPTAVVVGIGINVAWAGPPEVAGTCLDQLGPGAPFDRRTLLQRVLDSLGERLPLLDDAAGRRRLADEVRARCATLGRQVRVVLPDSEITGLATAIDDAGHLVLDTAEGPRRISAGDVVYLRAHGTEEPGGARGV
jgi:BirA family transcriptional regulator, biotin operon repressor / biotin---[acetyl-CoA-carboxylase] ligase